MRRPALILLVAMAMATAAAQEAPPPSVIVVVQCGELLDSMELWNQRGIVGVIPLDGQKQGRKLTEGFIALGYVAGQFGWEIPSVKGREMDGCSGA